MAPYYGSGKNIFCCFEERRNHFQNWAINVPFFLQNANDSDYNYDFDYDLETQLKKVSTKNELESLILVSSLRCAEVEIVFPDAGFHRVSQNFQPFLDPYTQSERRWPTESEEPDSSQITSPDKTTERQYHEVSETVLLQERQEGLWR